MEGLRNEAGYEKCSEKAFSDITYTHDEWCWLCFDCAVGEVLANGCEVSGRRTEERRGEMGRCIHQAESREEALQSRFSFVEPSYTATKHCPCLRLVDRQATTCAVVANMNP